jgi:prolyl oligopeptidase
VIEVSLAHPSAKPKTIVAESRMVLQRLALAKDALYVQALDAGLGKLLRVPLDGSATREVSLPTAGSIAEMTTDPRTAGIVFRLEGWTQSTRYFAYDPRDEKIADTGVIPASKANFSQVEAQEMHAIANDGTRVPLSIMHLRGLKRDGEAPTLLVGYGAYGFNFAPRFDPQLLAWLEKGGIYAVAHVRGGGEYGNEWYLGGYKNTKPNTIQDFVACAEYLVAKGYTSPQRLAGQGRSAGGITIGGAITRRPDLFAAAISAVGVADAVRMETGIGGAENTEEFGSVKTEEGFRALYAVSPYHHIKDGVSYPAVMLTTGVHDARVEPWHSAKMAARLQAATSARRPVLLRVDYDSGHGAGATRAQHNAERADEYAFLLWQLVDHGEKRAPE